MADTTGKQFAADALKKTGTWAGVTAAAIAALTALHPEVGTEHLARLETILTLVIVPALRGVLALLQGNIGDRSKASFAAADDDDGDGDDG